MREEPVFKEERPRNETESPESRLKHDLRNYLNLMMGFADLLALENTGMLNEKQRLYLENIRTGTRQMLNLINSNNFGINLDKNTSQSGSLSVRIRR